MMKNFLRKLLAVTALALPVAALATPTVTTTHCSTNPNIDCITGVKDLVISGVAYDVDVSVIRFSDLPGTAFKSYHDVSFAYEASHALTTAFNSYLPRPPSDYEFFDTGKFLYYDNYLQLPVDVADYGGDPVGGFDANCSSINNSLSFFTTTCLGLPSSDIQAFALFTPSAGSGGGTVPEPPGLLLIGLAIGALGFSRAKRHSV